MKTQLGYLLGVLLAPLWLAGVGAGPFALALILYQLGWLQP